MVRNNQGGKHGKKVSRKNTNVEEQNKDLIKVRTPVEDGELFACSLRLLGNGTFLAVDFSKNEYICVIRKKFKGRGKSHNTIIKGTWIMIGKRPYEKQLSPDKLPKCDLLEVYSDKEKQILRKKCPDYDWNLFDSYGDVVNANEEFSVEFNTFSSRRDNQQTDYIDMIENIDDLSDNDGECEREERDEFGNTISATTQDNELIDVNSI